MDYFELFERPTNKEILNNREVSTVSDIGSLVTKLESLDRKKESILVNFPIVPCGDYPAYEDWLNFLKRGPEINLRVPASREESIKDKLGPVRLRIEAVERINPEKIYCGYTWTAQRSRVKKKVHLVDCLEGARLFNITEKDKEHQIRISGRYKEVRDIADFGATFVAEVPSREYDIPYCITLRSIPLPRTREQYSIWTDFNTEHGCKIKNFESVCFRRTKEDIFCPHEIAAALKVVSDYYREHGKPLIAIPFAIPTETTVKFYLAARNNTLIEETKIVSKKLKKIKRPLNKAELEALLWKFVATKKDEKGRLHRPTLFTKTKLANYDWD